MIQIEKLEVNGQTVEGLRICEPGGAGHPNMLVILCKKGYIMCGYLNMETADAVSDAKTTVVGGRRFEETLANPVKSSIG